MDFFVKPEQISGSFFDPDTINFPFRLRGRFPGVSRLQLRHQVGLLRHPGCRIRVCEPEKLQQQKDPCRNSCIKIRYKVCFFRHSGFCVRIRKPEKFQQQKDSCRFQGCFSYLFPSVSVSPRMVWTIQIADSVPSFQDFLGFVFTVSRFPM